MHSNQYGTESPASRPHLTRRRLRRASRRLPPSYGRPFPSDVWTHSASSKGVEEHAVATHLAIETLGAIEFKPAVWAIYPGTEPEPWRSAQLQVDGFSSAFPPLMTEGKEAREHASRGL